MKKEHIVWIEHTNDELVVTIIKPAKFFGLIKPRKGIYKGSKKEWTAYSCVQKCSEEEIDILHSVWKKWKEGKIDNGKYEI